MIEEPKQPRLDGEEIIIETQSETERYDAKYLVAALLVYVARGDGTISGRETAEMIELVKTRFGLPSSASLELLTQATEDIAENPDFEGLLTDLSVLLSTEEKETAALMMLKVAAADGKRDTAELEKVQRAAELIGLPADNLHRAYDRYFEETQV